MNTSALKIIGRRSPSCVDLQKADDFLKLVLALREGKPFIPKGVHRFVTFEQSNQWSLKMMSRRPSPGPPTIDDLLRLCKYLNEARALYIVIGGMAIIHAGFLRATEEIDLLIEETPDNQQKVRIALEKLPDKAVSQMADDDLKNYIVVRIADEIVVDLLIKAGGIDYQSAKEMIVVKTINGIDIPFASPELLFQMKQTMREKDKQDILFLQQLLSK